MFTEEVIGVKGLKAYQELCWREEMSFRNEAVRHKNSSAELTESPSLKYFKKWGPPPLSDRGTLKASSVEMGLFCT